MFDMERHTFAFEIKIGQVYSFRSLLGNVWEELTRFMDRNLINNFSMWAVDRITFCYYEMGKNGIISKEDEKFIHTTFNIFDGYINWISSPFEKMDLMYSNYGILRPKKEMIRHRVFMARLKEGCESEYKDRHDRLKKSNSEKGINMGPDSNFSIWHAQGYIFGYDEIDTSMEKDETPTSMKEKTDWETKQLEIMEWISNDMDWLTREVRPACIRIAWHCL